MSSNIWSIVFSVIIGLLGIDILIIVHEVGHFILAKAFHVYVEKIQIGFGPSVVTKVASNGTQYSLGLIPYGAFCRMDSFSLNSVSPYKRILIYLAGPIANILLAIICYTVYLCILKNPLIESIKLSILQSLNEFNMFFNAIGNMITGQAKIGDTLSGFLNTSLNLGLLTRSGFSAGLLTGLETALWLTASVSVSLAFANLVPIPALDGGFILLSLIELIFRRDFSEEFKIILQLIGLLLLLVVLPILRFFF